MAITHGVRTWAVVVVSALMVASCAGQDSCNAGFFADGDCDRVNNNAECGYDGGDCCECTCVSGFRYDCENSDFACIDPDAECVDDDDVTVETVGCIAGFMGDAYCDAVNNNEACDYDGGDCCECTCTSTDLVSCGRTRDFSGSGFSCVDPSASCVGGDDEDTQGVEEEEGDEEDGDGGEGVVPFDEGDDQVVAPGAQPTSAPATDSPTTSKPTSPPTTDSPTTAKPTSRPSSDGPATAEPTSPPSTDSSDDAAVEVGTKTGVSVMATAHDERAGRSSDDVVGCGDVGGDGCAPYLAHDGVSAEVESRWSCAGKIVPEGGVCEIEFVFDEPQDVVDIEVAFWKGNQRTRTLEVKINGEHTHTHESYAGATFNTLGVEADDVYTVALEAIYLEPDEWISLIEVVIMVKP